MADVWQREYLVKNKVLSDDTDEFSKELPEVGLIDSIDIQFRATNGGTSNKDNPIDYIIKAIEVIGNGSDVLTSLEGRELRKLNQFMNNGIDGMLYDENADAKQYLNVNVPFSLEPLSGRYGIDCSKWDSLDIKIDYDLTRQTAAAATAYLTAVSQLNVILNRKTGRSHSPKGFIKTSEIDEYTTVGGDVTEEIKIPKRNKLIHAMVHCYDAAVAEGTPVDWVELNFEDGSKIPWKGNWVDLLRFQARMYKISCDFKALLFKSDTDTIATHLGTIDFATCHPMHTQDVGAAENVQTVISSIAGDTITLDSADLDATPGAEGLDANTTDHTIFVHAHSPMMGGCVMVPLGVFGDGEVFDASNMGALSIDINDKTSGGLVRTILQELVTKQGA